MALDRRKSYLRKQDGLLGRSHPAAVLCQDMPDAAWRRAAAATHKGEGAVGIGGWLRPPELVLTAAVHGQVNEPDDKVRVEMRGRDEAAPSSAAASGRQAGVEKRDARPSGE